MRIPRSVIDLLREQPEETLVEMHTSILNELERLRVELQQVEEALSKKTRRRKPSGRAGMNGRTTVTREQVFEAVRTGGRPMKPSEVRDAFAALGTEVTTNALRNSLRRLHDEKRLERDADNRYYVQPLARETEADSLLSRVNQPHSHG
jgi:hypothetical protein